MQRQQEKKFRQLLQLIQENPLATRQHADPVCCLLVLNAKTIVDRNLVVLKIPVWVALKTPICTFLYTAFTAKQNTAKDSNVTTF
jgi:hypothetical protein